MSESSCTPSLYNLSYPSDSSVFTITLPLPISPIDYEQVTPMGNEGPDNRQGLNAYNDSYIVDTGISTHYDTPAPSLMLVGKRAVKHRLPCQMLPLMRMSKLPVTKNTLKHLGSIGIQTAGIPGIGSYIKAAPSNVHTLDTVYTTVCPTKWVQKDSDINSSPRPCMLQYWTSKHDKVYSAQNRFFRGNLVLGSFSGRLKTLKTGFARLFPWFLGLNNF